MADTSTAHSSALGEKGLHSDSVHPLDDSDGSNNSPVFEAHEKKNLAAYEDEEIPNVDPLVAKKLFRKLDLRILPILMVLWFLSFIDRVNIGNARGQGLEKDLGMKGNDFNVALTVFFATFIAFEPLFNAVLASRNRKFPPRLWLGGQVFFLAIFTIAEGLVQNFAGIISMRLMIGIFEAGLVPGSVLFLSAYYPRYQLQWRMSILSVANTLASAFGGLLAYLIIGLDGRLGYRSWRWVFIIEGSITAVFALLSMWLIVDWPDRASFLSEEDRRNVQLLLAKDANKYAQMDTLNSDSLKRCLLDWKIWLNVLIYACTVSTTYSLNLFGPTIITGLDPTYDNRKVLILFVPIFLVAAVGTMASAWLSDKYQHRSGFVMGGFVISFIGFGILLQPAGVVTGGIRYMAIYFVAFGTYISLPCAWTMMANNVSGMYKTAFASSLQIGFGSVGGIIASSAYRVQDAPLYHTGHLAIFMILILGLVLTLGFVTGLYFEKKKRQEGKRDYRLRSPHLNNMGDDHPAFIFKY